ncbi:MAG: hypothetical protein JO015_14565 [Verrucomicrobia bacterium]|nr:hypothetical protein [Verrucomicrobiota bacterium]
MWIQLRRPNATGRIEFHRIVLAQTGQHVLAVGITHGLGIPLRAAE